MQMYKKESRIGTKGEKNFEKHLHFIIFYHTCHLL